MDLYSEIILDHYKNPRNKGTLKGANASSKDVNPLCGDKVYFYLKVDDSGRIEDARFDGSGCAISQAAASMIAEILPGKKVADIRKWDEKTVFKLLNAELSPARTKCALLSLKVLNEALDSLSLQKKKGAKPSPAGPERVFTEKNPYYMVLNGIIDPETQIGLSDMGLIYDAMKKGSKITVKMTLTSMGCPIAPYFIEEIEYRLKQLKGVKEVMVELVWDPPWTPDRIKPEIRAVLGF